MKQDGQLIREYEERQSECRGMLELLENKEIPPEKYSEIQNAFYSQTEKHIPFEMCSEQKKIERLIDLNQLAEDLQVVIEDNT